MMVPGVQYVMMNGLSKMATSSANNLDLNLGPCPSIPEPLMEKEPGKLFLMMSGAWVLRVLLHTVFMIILAILIVVTTKTLG